MKTEIKTGIKTGIKKSHIYRRRWLFGLVLLLGLLAGATTCQAAPKAPSCAKTQTVYCRVQKDAKSGSSGYSFANPNKYIFIKNLAKDAQITDFRSTDPSVRLMLFPGYQYLGFQGLMVEWAQGDRSTFQLNKKVKFSFTVRQNGKKYKLSTTVTFKKQKALFKQLKIGNKDLTEKITGCAGYSGVKISGSKAKLCIKPVSGVKVDRIEAYYRGENGFQKVKSGTTLQTKGLYSVIIYYSTKAPENYKAPKQWPLSMWETPLQDSLEIKFK